MSTFKKTINRFRKVLLTRMTQQVGSYGSLSGKLKEPSAVKRVLVIRPNHRLGNQLLMTPLVQEIAATFPNARIDLFAGKVAPILFQNYPQVDRIIRIPRKPFKERSDYVKAWLKLRSVRYDLVVNVERLSSSGRLATRFARSAVKLYGEFLPEIEAAYPDCRHIAKYPVYYLRQVLGELGCPTSGQDMPCLDLKLSPEEKAAGKQVLEGLAGNSGKPILSLYTYATGDKCYSEAWWSAFYEQLKTRFPGCDLIEILPVENISMIGFQAPSLYSKDVREMAAVMYHTKAYIGADCGVMHLASAAGIPTFGFFSVTDPSTYAPYNPGSKAFLTSEVNPEEIFAELEKVLA